MSADPSAPRFRLGHRPWLDGLRGAAVLLVLLFHLRLISGGFLGVDVFFVLSGFLITCLLVEEWERRGSIRLGRFYLRRALRLAPALIALLIACVVYVAVVRPETLGTFQWEVLIVALYITNWPTWHGVNVTILGHTWSLAIEEQFYLLWPIILIGLLRLRLKRRTILGIVGAAILTTAVHRAVLLSTKPPPGPEREALLARLYVGLDTRADGLLVGCFVGLLAVWGMLPTSRSARVASSIAVPIGLLGFGVLLMRSSPDHQSLLNGLFTVVALIVGTTITRELTTPSLVLSRVLSIAPLTALGRVSYAVYLWHMPIIAELGPQTVGWRAPGRTLLAIGLTIVAAVASFHLVERPCLKLKERLAKAERP